MKKCFLILVCLFSINIFAQVSTVTAGDVSSAAGDSVVIPINVQNFTNVGAITLKIQYTSSVLSWGRALNWDPQLGGALANATNGVVTIAWDAIAGMNLSNGKLVDLKFLFNGGSTVMDFIEAQCEIADVNGNIISTSYINGYVSEASLINIIIDTNPTGLDISADGESFTAPHTFSWAVGSQHQISTTSTQNAGLTQYVWNNWTNGGAISHNYIVPNNNQTITANFDTYYLLEMMSGSGDGSITPNTGFYLAGTQVPITATPSPDYYFSGWSGSGNGSYSGTNSSATVTMNEPLMQTAFFEWYEIYILTPQSGDQWISGNQYNITWNDNFPENVTIELYKGGAFNSTIAASTPSNGTYSWTIPLNQLAGSDYRIRIARLNSTTLDDYSGQFTISQPTNINITVNPESINFGNVPNGGIYVDTVTIINGPNSKANLSGNISVSGTRFPIFSGGGSYSLLPGEQRKVIIWFVPDQNGTYHEDLSITHNSSQVPSPILVPLDANVFTPNITVTAPLAGATWTVSSNQTVTWSSSNVTVNVNIKLSTDGGSTYPVTLATNTANDGTESITVPNNISTTCRVRVESVNDTSIFGVNPGNFTIVGASYITVTSPNGSESWVSGNQYNITWTDNISENVKIDLYKGGVFNSTIIASTASNGTYSWSIPLSQITGNDYKVRITSVNTGTLYDESSSNFTINQPVITVTTSSNPTNGGTTSGGGTYIVGAPVTVTASANSGYTFTNWTENDSVVSTNTSYQFTMPNNNRILVANFTAIQLTVSPLNQPVAYTAGNTTFSVTSNTSWTVSDNATWLTLAPVSGSGNATLTASFTENTTTSQRVGTITVTGGGITRTVTVTQIARPLLIDISFDKTEINFGDINNGQISVDTINISNNPNSTDNLVGNITLLGDRFAIFTGGGEFNIQPNNTHKVIIQFIPDSSSSFSGTLTITHNATNQINPFNIPLSGNGVTGIENLELVNVIPSEYNLSNNYPNPFNPSTRIQFGLPEESTTSLKVYDILGNEVNILLNNETIPAGNYSYNLFSDGLPSGVYFYVLITQSNVSKQSFRDVKKMILLK